MVINIGAHITPLRCEFFNHLDELEQYTIVYIQVTNAEVAHMQSEHENFRDETLRILDSIQVHCSGNVTETDKIQNDDDAGTAVTPKVIRKCQLLQVSHQDYKQIGQKMLDDVDKRELEKFENLWLFTFEWSAKNGDLAHEIIIRLDTTYTV